MCDPSLAAVVAAADRRGGPPCGLRTARISDFRFLHGGGGLVSRGFDFESRNQGSPCCLALEQNKKPGRCDEWRAEGSSRSSRPVVAEREALCPCALLLLFTRNFLYKNCFAARFCGGRRRHGRRSWRQCARRTAAPDVRANPPPTAVDHKNFTTTKKRPLLSLSCTAFAPPS